MEQWNNTFYYKTYLYILLRTRTYAAAGTLPHVRCCGHTHTIYYVRGHFDLKKIPLGLYITRARTLEGSNLGYL